MPLSNICNPDPALNDRGDSTQVAARIEELSVFTGDPNLVTLYGAPARRIRVITAGSGGLVVTMPGVRGTPLDCTLSGLVAGEDNDGIFTAIKTTGTTVAKIRLYF